MAEKPIVTRQLFCTFRTPACARLLVVDQPSVTSKPAQRQSEGEQQRETGGTVRQVTVMMASAVGGVKVMRGSTVR